MQKRSLFISFAESDGGHSYLAARAMLDPSSIAHLIFKNTVSESLEALGAGQSNFAIVPSYNSITQWEGATLKALASGAFEIHAQVCMPTSYVLVAHKDYINEFVGAYFALTNPNANPTPEDAAKIYTRFLSRIFVGAQAEEQYRGRLVRPDMTHATIDLSRNPLRVLEEMTRSEFMRALAANNVRGPLGGFQNQTPSNQSGGFINIGATPYPSPAAAAVMAPPIMETLQAPASLVAAGLLDAPGDPEGWDQPGSLGEIVALLRKLLVLLNVYSLGAPDLPENKTQYLLLGRRGAGAPAAGALRAPAAAPTRIMTLVRPSLKRSSADQWLKPRTSLERRVRDFGFVLDRAPLMISAGAQRGFLFEGGKPKDGASAHPMNMVSRMFRWLGEAFEPPADPSKPSAKDKSLRKAIEKKPERDLKDDTPSKFDMLFLGQYPTWCQGLTADSCWCCEEAHADSAPAGLGEGTGMLFFQILGSILIATMALALLFWPAYCAITGSCHLFEDTPRFVPPENPPATLPSPKPESSAPQTAPAERPHTAYPGVTTAPKAERKSAPAATNPILQSPAHTPYPGLTESAPQRAEPKAQAKKFEPPKPMMFHVAFFEEKANLTSESLDVLASAASQTMQMNRVVNIRLVSLGAKENDLDLWRRRLHAVKDELVRLGVPHNRLSVDGAGPYLIMIRSYEPARPRASRTQRLSYDLDSIDDPLASD